MTAPYHKIQTVWLRDPATSYKTLMDGVWAKTEFGYLADAEWEFTEKVDGTNIRVIWDGTNMDVRGKTDDAQLPPGIHAAAQQVLPKLFTLPPLTIYCEGFGPKIQGGGKYRADQGLAVFDVYCGDLWLERENMLDICYTIGMDAVPLVGSGTLMEMVDRVRGGIQSKWGGAVAEGIVARPAVELQNRRGERVITKLKAKDLQ